MLLVFQNNYPIYIIHMTSPLSPISYDFSGSLESLFPETQLFEESPSPEPQAAERVAVTIKVDGAVVARLSKKRCLVKIEPVVEQEPDAEELKKAKKEARRIKNCESAQASRDRHKQYVDNLIAENKRQARTIAELEHRLNWIVQRVPPDIFEPVQ